MDKKIANTLLKYSAAAGAGAFSLTNANAKIVHQADLDGFIPLSSVSNSSADDAFSIDIDNNGTDDVSFAAFSAGINVARAFDQFSTSAATDLGFTLSPSNTNNYYLFGFGSGELIDESGFRGNEIAPDETGNRAGGANFNNMQHTSPNGFVSGSATGTRYLGLEFFRKDVNTQDVNIHFGWIEAEVEDIGEGVLQLTISDYAWENTPGTGINAGTVPEPATYALGLGLLALGAAGIRARRQASKQANI